MDIIYFFSLFKNQTQNAVNGKFKYNCIHIDMYEYYYAFVGFKGGQYQDGLMATCPVEETNEMLSVQIRVDDNFQISIYFVRLQVASK